MEVERSGGALGCAVHGDGLVPTSRDLATVLRTTHMQSHRSGARNAFFDDVMAHSKGFEVGESAFCKD